MSAAREKLTKSAKLLHEAAQRDDLISRPPNESAWNEHARLLKAALCISSFTAMEEFVQSRIREIISSLHGFPPTSLALPAAMKAALVTGALDSLIARIRDPSRFNISDINQLIVDHTRRISSFSSPGIDPSDLALSTNGSNVSWAIIENALMAFSIENPPSVVSGVAKRLVGGVFSAKDHFENVIAWRHRIAHVSGSDIPLAETREFVSRLPLFCAAFDFSISTGASRIISNRAAKSVTITKNNNISIRFVEWKTGQWRSIAENASRASYRNPNLEDTLNNAIDSARPGNQCVAQKSSAHPDYIESWSTPFI